MPIAGINTETLVDNQVLTNNDEEIVNLDNNTVIGGYAGNQIEKYVKYIDGLNIEVDYYSFVRGVNGETSLLDVGNTSQQYIEVKQLLLKVVTPIPDGSNYTDISLDAVLDANIIPAENDLAIMRLPNGLEGVFKISINDKRTYITRKIYDIKLTLLYLRRDNPEYYDNLLSKVKKKYVYDKSYILTNSAPVLLETTYRNKMNAANLFSSMSKQYVEFFINEKVLSVYNTYRIFDINIQNLVLALVDASLYSTYKPIESHYDRNNIVTYILEKKSKFNTLKRYYEYQDVSYEISMPHTISLLGASVDKTVWLSDTEATITPLGGIASSVIPNNYRTITSNLYMFSNSFYTATVGLDELSTLENLLISYVKNETINYDDLEVVVTDIENWNILEQYNYIPFVLLLLNYFNLNTYDRI